MFQSLGFSTDGQYESRDSLLAFVPHSSPHGTSVHHCRVPRITCTSGGCHVVDTNQQIARLQCHQRPDQTTMNFRTYTAASEYMGLQISHINHVALAAQSKQTYASSGQALLHQLMKVRLPKEKADLSRATFARIEADKKRLYMRGC